MMFEQKDLSVLCCPKCRGDLDLRDRQLDCQGCAASFPVVDGIPRLLHFSDEEPGYNSTWDYKWMELDGGKGWNFEIIETGSPAYNVHNVIRFFEDEATTWPDASSVNVACDIGCGTGQYGVRLLQLGVGRVYAIDLTRGVDIGRRIVASRFPELLDRIVFIQANARFLPVRSGCSDFTMALASIHHSGHLEDCVGEVSRVTRAMGRLAVWIYAKPLIPLGDAYRRQTFGYFRLMAQMMYILWAELIHSVAMRLPHVLLLALVRLLASDTVYALRRLPILGRCFSFLTPGVTTHSEKGYRLINLYDAYSPGYSEASDEGDVIRWGKKFSFDILAFVPWRLGFVGAKK